MDESYSELSLADYLSVLRRRWRLIAVLTVVCAALGFAWSSTRTKQYRAATQVIVSAQAANQSLDPTAAQTRDVARLFENELLYARSRGVLDALEADLGYRPAVSVSGQSKTADLLTFTATGTEPAKVAAAADAYAELYISSRTSRMVEASATTRQAVLDKLGDLRAELDILDLDNPADRSRAAALEEQIGLYEQYTNGLDLVAELAAASNAQIVSQAEVPTAPFAPQPVRTTILALALGLMAGTALAFLREFLDDTVRSKEDLEQLTTAGTTLALIPAVAKRDAGDGTDPLFRSSLGEPFRNLRTAVQFVGLRHSVRVLQVTSGRPAEGKTTVSANLAMTIAQSGTPVVLVEADLRRPTLAGRFGVANTLGLTNLMLGQHRLDEVLQAVPGCPGLGLITSGPTPQNAADFLWPSEGSSGAPTLHAIVQELADRGLTVIVDSPPVLPVADALTIARAVDATLFVVTAGVSSRRDITRALETLDHVEARVIGTVLNRSTDHRSSRYGYGYGYGYGHDEDRRRGLLSRLRRPRRRTPVEMPARLSDRAVPALQPFTLPKAGATVEMPAPAAAAAPAPAVDDAQHHLVEELEQMLNQPKTANGAGAANGANERRNGKASSSRKASPAQRPAKSANGSTRAKPPSPATKPTATPEPPKAQADDTDGVFIDRLRGHLGLDGLDSAASTER